MASGTSCRVDGVRAEGARFGAFILRTILVLVVFVILAVVVVRRDPMQSVLFALALAVGLAPEFLPMIRTVTLARAAVRMSRNSVIIKHLSSMPFAVTGGCEPSDLRER